MTGTKSAWFKPRGKAVPGNLMLRILQTLKGTFVYYSDIWGWYVPRLPMNNKPFGRIMNRLFSQQKPKVVKGLQQRYFGVWPLCKGVVPERFTELCQWVVLFPASTGKGRNRPKWNTTSDLKLYVLQAKKNTTPREILLTIFRNKEWQRPELELREVEIHPHANAHQTALGWQSSFLTFSISDRGHAHLHGPPCPRAWHLCIWDVWEAHDLPPIPQIILVKGITVGVTSSVPKGKMIRL